MDVEILDALNNNKFSVDLLKISISDPKGEKRTTLNGCGWIRKLSDKFTFKLFLSSTYSTNKNILDILNEWIESEKYPTVVGFDELDRKWSFKIENFGFRFLSNKVNFPIDGVFKKLDCEHEIDCNDNREYINFYFKKNSAFPFNKLKKIDLTKDGEIFQRHNEKLVEYQYNNLAIKSETIGNFVQLVFQREKFEDYFEVRIIESLKFITGKQLKPFIIEKKKKSVSFYTLFSTYDDDIDYKIAPPIEIENHSSPKYDDAWDLFGKFLDFVSEFKGEHYSPLGAEINGLIGAGPAFFNTKLLILGIRIEGILNLLFNEMGVPEDQIIEELSAVQKMVLDSSNIVVTKDRIFSTLEIMKQARTKDKLIKLKELGVINQLQYTSWNKLRNKSAHAVREDDENWFEKSMRQYLHVLEAFYRIIFYKINYNGLYTPYGSDSQKEIRFELYSK